MGHVAACRPLYEIQGLGLIRKTDGKFAWIPIPFLLFFFFFFELLDLIFKLN
jgi:hypothetical protein